MKVVITDGKGNVQLCDFDTMPEIKANQCLCRITACATCSGTDKKLVAGKFSWADDYPGILGHESVGTVIECGQAVRNFAAGDRVLRPAAAYPGTRIGGIGSWMGGFAEYGIITDCAAEALSEQEDPFGYNRYQQLIPRDLDISDADASMLVMLKEVAGACRGSGTAPGKSVLILGSGAVAQGMCFFAHNSGAFPVIAAARRDDTLADCRRCGADYTVNVTAEDPLAAIMDYTRGHGTDILLDAAGNIDLVLKCAETLAENSVLASYATTDDGGGFPADRIRSKVNWSMCSGVAENKMHDEVIELVRKKILDPSGFYSHCMKFEDFEAGFADLQAKKANKIVFCM